MTRKKRILLFLSALLAISFFLPSCKKSKKKMNPPKKRLSPSQKAIETVLASKTRKGFILKNFIENYLQLTNLALLKKDMPPISEDRWKATCKKRICRVSWIFGNSQFKLSARWMLQKGKVIPLNSLARQLLQLLPKPPKPPKRKVTLFLSKKKKIRRSSRRYHRRRRRRYRRRRRRRYKSRRHRRYRRRRRRRRKSRRRRRHSKRKGGKSQK